MDAGEVQATMAVRLQTIDPVLRLARSQVDVNGEAV